MALSIEQIDLKELKEALKALNESPDWNGKIRLVGISKIKQAEEFTIAVEELAKLGEDKVPAVAVNLYNKMYGADEEGEEGADVEEGKEEAGKEEKEAAPAAEEKPKTEKVAKPPKSAAKKSPPKPPPFMRKPESFDDIVSRLEKPATPTAAFDALTLQGGTLAELVADFKEVVAKSYPDFSAIKTASSAKSHIDYRESKGWVYEREGDSVKLVGYKG